MPSVYKGTIGGSNQMQLKYKKRCCLKGGCFWVAYEKSINMLYVIYEQSIIQGLFCLQVTGAARGHYTIR